MKPDPPAGNDSSEEETLKLFEGTAPRPEPWVAWPGSALPPMERQGDAIGHYKLLEELGKGGFGVVWRAEQTEPIHREVALKVIKPGMDTVEVIARFESERQALAMMDHPNIAGVLDAGTTQNGRPFFVMELVKGVPITEYCDAHKLSIHQRLELFIPVCQAVQHAHQKAILHRDLKPANILVTEVDGKPLPKVIDFGIAKALHATDEPALHATLARTVDGMFVGTPQYMSPEQAGSVPDVDTRSDIYTLGIILYELLVGDTPLNREQMNKAALDEVLRLIRESEAQRPSSKLNPITGAVRQQASCRHSDPTRLSAALRGDLDWIVLKAVDKERSQRYETANALAQDLQCYLRDEPVSAGPPSAAYRFAKLARRHRIALTAGALVLMSLVVGLGMTLWQAMRASSAERGAVAAGQQLRLDASQADANLALQLSHGGRGDLAFACAVRALTLNHDNELASLLAYRMLSDRTVTPPDHLVAHKSTVCSMAFSRDGFRLATGCDDGSAFVVELESGRRFTLPEKLAARPVVIAFSPDGNSLVMGTSQAGIEAEVATWEYATGAKAVPIASAQLMGNVVDLGWPLPDRIVVTSASERSSLDEITQVFGRFGREWKYVFGAGVWDLRGRAPYLRCGTYDAWATGKDGLLIIWKSAAREISWYDMRKFPENTVPLFSITLTGANAPVGSGEETWQLHEVHVAMDTACAYFRTAAGFGRIDPFSQEIKTVSFLGDGVVRHVSSNGGRIVIDNRQGFAVLESTRGTELDSRGYHLATGPNLLDFTSDGTCWALGESHQVLVGQTGSEGGHPIVSLALPAECHGGIFDAAGDQLAIRCADNSVRIWSMARLLCRAPSLVDRYKEEKTETSTRVVPGKIGVSEAGTVAVVQIRTDTARKLGQGYQLEKTSLYRVETGSGERTLVQKLDRPATGYCFSPDGSRLAITVGSWSWRSEVNTPTEGVLINTATGEQVGEPLHHNDDAFSPAFSPDSEWFVTISDDGTVHRWRAEDGAERGEPIRLPGANGRMIRYVTVAPNGKTILTADGTLIDAGLWRPIKTLELLEHRIANACFEPSGASVVTASEWRKFVLLEHWDLRSGLRIGEPVSVSEEDAKNALGEAATADSEGILADKLIRGGWLETGRRLKLGNTLVWDCAPPLPSGDLLRFYEACRPMLINDAGELTCNLSCSTDAFGLRFQPADNGVAATATPETRGTGLESYFQGVAPARRASVITLAKRLLGEMHDVR